MDARGAVGALPLSTMIGGRFQIESFLRTEGGTELYQAKDTRDDVPAWVRLFPCPPALRAVLESDLSHAAATSHKNLATILAWGYEGDRAYVATEPLDGATLREIIDLRKAQNQVVGLPHAHVLLGHAANGLEASYPHLPHGGVNPASMRLNSAGRVKIANLGLSRALPALARLESATGQGATPYLAPEVAAGAAPSHSS